MPRYWTWRQPLPGVRARVRKAIYENRKVRRISGFRAWVESLKEKEASDDAR